MEAKLQKIKAFVFDVDGVLTDGGILSTPEGDLLRVFDSKDAFALRMVYMKGYHVGVITGGVSESIRLRFKTCGVPMENIYLGSRAKIEDLEDFCGRYGLEADEIMYFGDDLPDIPVMLACGCGVAPSDAVEEAKAEINHKTIINTSWRACSAIAFVWIFLRSRIKCGTTGVNIFGL